MKKTLMALLLATMSASVHAALKEGDFAPDFEAQASLAGKAFNYSLREAVKKGPVVVYFYPSAYTGGCNIEAHAFSENIEKFKAAGASVIGVSLDGLDRLNDFSADPQYCAGKVAVASDADGKIAKAYEVEVRPAAAGKKDTRGVEIAHGFAERITYVIGRNGKVASALAGLKPDEHVAKALEEVQQLIVRDW